MRKIFLILGGLVLFFGFSAVTSAVAQDKADDKTPQKEFEAIYQELDEAAKKRDVKPYEKYLAESFEAVQDGRKIPRSLVLQALEIFFQSATEISEAATKLEKISVRGDMHSVETSSVVKGKFKMPDGKISNLEIRTQTTDVWVKSDKGWREIGMTERGSKILVDGKETGN